MDGAVHRTVLGCTSLPMACLGWELCARQLLKSKPRLKTVFLYKVVGANPLVCM